MSSGARRGSIDAKALLRSVRSSGQAAAWVLAISVISGCGAAETPGEDTSSVIFAKTFSGFRTWESFHYEISDAPNPEVHTSGPRTSYLNQHPPHGSTSFPVGTIIVKEIDGTDADTHKIFAMWKRGGKYNDGAPGWEWFELEEPSGRLVIKWRGYGPPNGENYGGDANGGCNTCHGAAIANDCVKSDALQLSKL